MNTLKMEKVVADVIEKLEKLKQTDLASDLSWCWVSFQNDGNPVGVIEKATHALAAFNEAREKNSKAVAKKLVDDLEKALA
jgi:methyltransferase-like protein